MVQVIMVLVLGGAIGGTMARQVFSGWRQKYLSDPALHRKFPDLNAFDHVAMKVQCFAAVVCALAGVGILYLAELLSERHAGYLWSSTPEHSSVPALYFRENGKDWPVNIRDGLLLIDSNKRVSPGVMYHAERPPHLRDNDGEPPADPRF